VKGLIADANIQGQVEYLVQRMRADAWADFWQELGLVLCRFEDVGLSFASTDQEVWNICQAEQLVLITDNRNLDSDDSLEATIRRNNTPASLPVFTIADMSEFRTDNIYVERVIEALYDYLLRIDDVRGAGRLYLP
jgi:predicted nuclease of predicted toxin-antitoxin system